MPSPEKPLPSGMGYVTNTSLLNLRLTTAPGTLLPRNAAFQLHQERWLPRETRNRPNHPLLADFPQDRTRYTCLWDAPIGTSGRTPAGTQQALCAPAAPLNAAPAHRAFPATGTVFTRPLPPTFATFTPTRGAPRTR